MKRAIDELADTFQSLSLKIPKMDIRYKSIVKLQQKWRAYWLRITKLVHAYTLVSLPPQPVYHRVRRSFIDTPVLARYTVGGDGGGSLGDGLFDGAMYRTLGNF